MLISEISQTEKDRYHIISLICGIRRGGSRNRLTDTEDKWMVARWERLAWLGVKGEEMEMY
jgi:hypothetical protein